MVLPSFSGRLASSTAAWSAAPEETSSAIGQIAGALEGLDEGLDGRVQAIIDALGLSEQYASAEDFLAALEYSFITTTSHLKDSEGKSNPKGTAQ